MLLYGCAGFGNGKSLGLASVGHWLSFFVLAVPSPLLFPLMICELGLGLSDWLKSHWFTTKYNDRLFLTRNCTFF